MAEQTQYSLYYYDTCPFCRRVLNTLPKVNADVELRNIMRDRQHRQDLINGGGRSTVPCLRIDQGGNTQWMYESMDIIRFLQSL